MSIYAFIDVPVVNLYPKLKTHLKIGKWFERKSSKPFIWTDTYMIEKRVDRKKSFDRKIVLIIFTFSALGRKALRGLPKC